MSKINKTQTENKSLKKVILFCLVVFILILLSFIVRIVFLIKDSRFDGVNKYTIAIINKNTKTYLLSFDPVDKNINEIVLVSGKNRSIPGKTLGVLVDATVILKSDAFLTKDRSDDIVYYLLLHSGNIKNNITFIDLLRLNIFAKTISRTGYNYKIISLPKDQNTLDSITSGMFSDAVIIDEAKSIEIVNGTGVDGLGKRLERIIKNAGGNIVAVTNTPTLQKYSKIYYYQNTSYTQSKLQRILNYESEKMQNREIADIKIVIGTDGIREEIF
jgi:hypothetical protein